MSEASIQTHRIIRSTWRKSVLCTVVLASFLSNAQAQPALQKPVTIASAFRNLADDQKDIWTSPLSVRRKHIKWIAPFIITTSGLIAGDAEVERQIQRRNGFGPPDQTSISLSDVGAVALAGLSAGSYVFGKLRSDQHATETGILAGEAAVNAAVVDYALKAMFQRPRPTEDTHGGFFRGGASFPSEHSAFAWSIAAVLAHEYPSPFVKLLSYGTASAVSVARVKGEQHFPADVFVGGVMGYMIGQHIYEKRHVEPGDDSRYGNFVNTDDSTPWEPTSNTFVPMDSWVYPQLDRLIGAGNIKTNIYGLRPWTRRECARMIEEAEENIGNGGPVDTDSNGPLERLKKEFAIELNGGPEVQVLGEEAYLRATGVVGPPLADDFHFAKTIVDDYGRPFGQGFNSIMGATTRAVAGPFGFYVRGEYQHAAPLPAYSPTTLNAIAVADESGTALQTRTSSLDQFRTLEAYVSLTLKKQVITFGKQSLWWGPGDSPFLLSNNAEAIPMLRYTQQSPFKLPWIFSLMGPMRVELFWAQLNGFHFVSLLDPTGTVRTLYSDPIRPHPYLHGEKLSFKPTQNIEFGFGVTTVFSGPGFPFTFRNLVRSYSISNSGVGAPDDPGDRRSAFDLHYRLPWVRDWLSLYVDSFAEDEFSPIAYPRRSAWRAGLFLARLPGYENANLHVEGVYTDLPNLRGPAGSYYHNDRFLSGYTNYGQILGSWVGREGRGVSAWSNIWLRKGSSLQFAYRNQHVNPDFLQGGDLNDARVTAHYAAAHSLDLSASLQYERWNFLLLSTAARSNFVSSVQLSFRPSGGFSMFK